MKRILSFILVLLCFPITVNALTVNVDTQSSLGGSNYEEYADLVQDKNGNLIAVGETNSTTLGDSTGLGAYDGLIAKYDKDNNLVWKKLWGGKNSDQFYGVAVLNDGNYVVVGESSSSDVEGLSNMKSNDAIVVKFDQNGNTIFVKYWGGSFTENFSAVEPTSDGGFIVAGTVYSSDISEIDFKGKADALVIKYDKDGNIEWQKNFGGSQHEIISKLQVTSDGGYVICGRVDSTDIPGMTIKGDNDALLVKLDKNGNVLWYRNFGGNDYDRFDGLYADEDGIVGVAYYLSTNISGAPNRGNGDNILIKYDNDGNLLWQKSIGGNSVDVFYDVIKTLDGGYIIAGQTASINIPGFTNKGSYDAIIVKYDKDGNQEWMKGWGGKYGDHFRSIVQRENGQYVVAGLYYSNDIEGIEFYGTQDSILVSFSVTYDINVISHENGSAVAKQEDNKAIITVKPDEGYIVDTIVAKDTKGKEVLLNKDERNLYSVILSDDITVEVTYKKEFKITLNEVKNGNATAEKIEEYKGKVFSNPNEGYKLDKLIIVDSKGQNVSYEEKDGYYYFDVNDDLTVTVLYVEKPKEEIKEEEEKQEEIENPKTADMFIYYSSAIVCTLFGIWSVEQYKKYKNEMN